MWNVIYDNKHVSWYVEVKTLGEVAETYDKSIIYALFIASLAR